MKDLKPFQIIFLAVFAVLAVGGLIAFSTFQGTGKNKPIAPVLIWGPLPGSAIQPGIDALRQANSQFKTITYVEHNPATFDTDLANALASGTGPDLILTNQEMLLGEMNKLAVIPSSAIPERTFLDAYLPITDVYLTTGGTYGVPLAVDPLVLYYNRTTLSNANIPQVPATWEAVVGLAPKLTKLSDAGFIQKSAIALGTYDNIPRARGIVSLLFLQSGSTVAENGQAGRRSTLASGSTAANGAAPGDSAMNFYTQFADPAKIVYTWNRSFVDARQSFLAGDVALYIGYASERAFIASANPNLDFDMAAIPQPETASNKVDYALAYAFAITKGSKNPTGAFKVAAGLAAKASDVSIASALGMAPSLRSALTPSASDKFTPVVYPSALISKGWLSPAPAVTDHIFAAMINSIVSGQQNVHNALVTADQSLTAALQ